MISKLRHIAIASEQHFLAGKFYELIFGLKSSGAGRGVNAAVLSDGYVGFNINGRRPGGIARLDHFGFEVSDVEELFARVRERYPSVHFLKRLSMRPFAGITMHDPAGNYFDIAHAAKADRKDVYADESLAGAEYFGRFHHLQLRALDPVELCQFYKDVFELQELPRDPDDRNHYLSDGRMMLVIAPWHIEDYVGGNVELPATDHLGFAVKSLDELQERLRQTVHRSPYLRPMELGGGDEEEARVRLLRTCRHGQYQLCDPEGVLLDVVEE
ncbi:MAG TPA: VOC family protein [Chloroflexota bacterium]|jgi:predicted enzyme related to lactoylglutathione lyase